jgi:16S rRNA G1207 methylase RsmC
VTLIPPNLKRYPARRRETLQAYDAADELILDHLATLELGGKRLLIVNDSFGALACALERLKGRTEIESYTDSYVAFRAAELNSGGQVRPCTLLTELKGVFDVVVLRLPKTSSFLEDILCHLTRHLAPGARVVSASMIKHLAKANFDLLNKYVGETTTSLAQKKARLVFAEFTRGPAESPYPLEVPVEGFEFPFSNQSNLFSREKLDIGTRFFLSHLPQGNFSRILDLGCANGIVGIRAKKLNPGAQVIFSDESRMAVESARANYSRYFPGDQAEFVWTNCYENREPGSVDLVLCNPPFHQGTTLGEHIAEQMFADAHRALAPGGLLRVIGNSHLGYGATLKRLFGNSQVVVKNDKFTIFDALNRKDGASSPSEPAGRGSYRAR